MNYDLKECGMRFRKLRKARGLTQAELALELHMSLSNLGKVEIGYTGFSLDTLIDISRFFSVTTEYILFGTTMGTPEQVQGLQLIIDTANSLLSGISTIKKNE